MPTTVSSLIVAIGSDISGLTTGLNNANTGVGGFVSNAGKGMIGVGAKITAATAPLTLFGAKAIGDSLAYESSLKDVGSVLGITGEKLNTLGDQVLEIGRSSRAGPQAAIEAYYDIAGGVLDTSKHMDILNASIATAEAGNADLSVTTNGLIAVMNAYNLEADQASHVSDVFTRTVGVGVGTMDEFVSALSPIAGIAQTAGISFDDLGAQAAYMSTRGFSAAQSATRIQAAITAFLKPNKQMNDALKLMGVESGTAALKQFGLAGSLKLLESVLGGSNDEMAAALGTTEALGAAVTLTQPELDDFWQTYRDGMNGATEAARAIQLTSAQAQIDIFNSSLSALSKTVGDVFTPVLGQLAASFTPIVNGITDWMNRNPELSGIIVAIAGAVALLGPVLIGLGTAIVVAAPAVEGLGIGVGILSGAFGLLFSPIILTAAAIGGLALVLTNTDIQKKLDELTGLDVTGFVNKLKIFGRAITDDLGAIDLSGFQTSIQTALSGLQLPTLDLSGFQTSITDSFQGLDFSGVGPVMDTHFNDILNAIISVAGIVLGGPVGMAIGAARLISLAISNDFLGIGTFLQTSGISDSVNTAFTDLKTTVDGIIQQVFGGGGGEAEGAKAGGTVKGFMAGVTGAIGGGGGGTGFNNPLALFVSDLQRGFDAAKNLFTTVWNDLSPHVEDLKTGIKGFFDAFKDTDTEGLLRVVTAIGGVVGGIAGVIVQVGGDVLGAAMSAIGASLPMMGEAISDLIGVISNIGKGDFGTAATTLGDVVTDIANSALAFLGIQITVPDFSAAIEGWRTGLEGVKLIIQGLVNDITAKLQDFVGSIRNFVIDFQLGILNLQATGANFLISIGVDVAGQQALLDSIAKQQQELGKQRYTPNVANAGVPHFAGGGTMHGDGLAYLHDQERILTPSQASSYDSGRGGGGNTFIINEVSSVDEIVNEIVRRGGPNLLQMGQA